MSLQHSYPPSPSLRGGGDWKKMSGDYTLYRFIVYFSGRKHYDSMTVVQPNSLGNGLLKLIFKNLYSESSGDQIKEVWVLF